jgi:UDP-N-acetylmuramate dehydrogenase
MNANAYGGALADVLEWVKVTDARGTGRRTPADLGFTYRSSNLRAGEVVTRACFHLRCSESVRIRARLAELRGMRKEAQPSGIRTFGSTFKNPAPDDPLARGLTAGQLLDAAGCRTLRVGGASFSGKHANFVENRGAATTADVVALMAEGRRRVKAAFGVVLEPEVQALGPVAMPADWTAA